jgi:hypothetical protein
VRSRSADTLSSISMTARPPWREKEIFSKRGILMFLTGYLFLLFSAALLLARTVLTGRGGQTQRGPHLGLTGAHAMHCKRCGALLAYEPLH